LLSLPTLDTSTIMVQQIPEGWLRLRHAPSRGDLAELSLVMAAVGVDHRLVFDGHQWGLWVPPEAALAAEAELQAYRQENRPAVRQETALETVDSGWFGVLGYLAVIWLLPSLEARQVFGWDWQEAGTMAAGAVLEGAWWRTITALTLHADIAHIVANSLFGGVFGLFVGRYLGSGLGWLLILLAGALGNTVNALVQPDGFRSIGASTATFAAVGVLGAFVWRRGYFRRGGNWRRNFAPIFAGIAMLAYTGMGGENTDILAHVFGFAAGVACGTFAAVVRPANLGPSGQGLAGAAALALIAFAWYLAGSGVWQPDA
jgi:membrane associated rhomboid family serine protease